MISLRMTEVGGGIKGRGSFFEKGASPLFYTVFGTMQLVNPH